MPNDPLKLLLWNFVAEDETDVTNESKTETEQANQRMMKLMKEITETIPEAGFTMMYSTDGRLLRGLNHGRIKMKLNLSSEKTYRDAYASKDHRHLLKVILYHELEKSQVADYSWCGKFSENAEIIIAHHQAQSVLSHIEAAFAQWAVFTEVNQHYSLSLEMFDKILDVLVHPIQNMNVPHAEEINVFWESTRRLLPSCFGIIENLRKKVS